MNIVQLQYLAEAVRGGSYDAAAKKLYVSGQAISKAIVALERELNVELIVRNRGKVFPTEFGETFITRVDDLLLNFNDLAEIAKEYRREPERQASYSLAITSLPLEGLDINRAAFDVLHRKYPDVEITIIPNSSGACLTAVEEGIVDAAIILGRVVKPALRCLKLFSVTPRIALSHNNPLGNNTSIKLEELYGSSILRPDDIRYVQQEITKQLTTRNIVFEFIDISPSIEERRRFFEENDGFMFALGTSSSSREQSPVITKPLDDRDRFAIPVCLVRPEKPLSYPAPFFEQHLFKVLTPELYYS